MLCSFIQSAGELANLKYVKSMFYIIFSKVIEQDLGFGLKKNWFILFPPKVASKQQSPKSPQKQTNKQKTSVKQLGETTLASLKQLPHAHKKWQFDFFGETKIVLGDKSLKFIVYLEQILQRILVFLLLTLSSICRLGS